MCLMAVVGFLFGLIAGGINNAGAVWGATDSWPTVEMQARYVNCLLSFLLDINLKCPAVNLAHSTIITHYIAQSYSEELSLSGGKRGDYQNCSVLYCVLKLCTVIITLR